MGKSQATASMAKQMRNSSGPLLEGKCKLKVMTSCHFIALNLGKTNKTDNKASWWDTGKDEFPVTGLKMLQPLEKPGWQQLGTQGSLVGCRLWNRAESDTTDAT